MDLGNGITVKLDVKMAAQVATATRDPTAVWPVRTDASGNIKDRPWSSPYRFWSEGRCVTEDEIVIDLNDYLFGSLTCMCKQSY